VALGACPECDASVSTFAHFCPNCGCPFHAGKTEDSDGFSGFKKAESVAKIISLIALPVLVAVGGWFVQSNLSKNDAKSEYIQIAIGILQQETEADQTLKEWAAETLALYSEVPFDSQAFTDLKSGKVVIPKFLAVPAEFGFVPKPDIDFKWSPELEKKFEELGYKKTPDGKDKP